MRKSNSNQISFSITCCRIYLYNILQLDKGPVQSFSGCRIDSFFIRVITPLSSIFPSITLDLISNIFHTLTHLWNLALQTMISSDGEHILSGSGDGNAYIWQVWILCHIYFYKSMVQELPMLKEPLQFQVNKPHVDPTILKGHDNEVTAVDWYVHFTEPFSISRWIQLSDK